MHWTGRWVPVLAVVALIAANAFACRRHCAHEASQRSPWPYLTDDHPLHYGNALATRHFLRASATNAGYDPFFMAGYAKSSVWPTNPLLEIIVFLTPTLDPARVFKGYVWSSAAAVPLALVYAGWRLRVSTTVVLFAILFWVLQYWAGFPFHTFHYVQFGMAAFVWSAPLMFAAGAALQHWLRAQTAAAALEMGVLAGLAVMAHATVGYLLGVPAVLAFFLHAQARSWKGFRQALLAAAVAVALNYWWIVPLVLLRDAWGQAPAFFKNPNVLERLADLFRLDHPDPVQGQPGSLLSVVAPVVPYLVGPPLMGVLLLLAALNGRRLGAVGPLVLLWVFLLAFPAGLIERTTFLQLGRNTLHLNAWLCLPAAAALVFIWKAWPPLPRRFALAAVGWCLLCGAIVPVQNMYDLFASGRQATTAEMVPGHFALLQELRRQAGTARRVLFEVFEDREPAVRGPKNPFGSIRLSPLLPHETGLEVVGGPYLATHYRTNFTNCGEGTFIGGRPWTRGDAEEYFRIYALDLAVLWSRPALEFAAGNPDLLEPVKRFGDIHLFKIRRLKTPLQLAGIRVAATYNQIVVENPTEIRGVFVLPYHATNGWTCTPSCELRSVFQGDDPVPFLALVGPPAKVTLRFSPWKLSAPPLE